MTAWEKTSETLPRGGRGLRFVNFGRGDLLAVATAVVGGDTWHLTFYTHAGGYSLLDEAVWSTESARSLEPPSARTIASIWNELEQIREAA